MKVRERSKIPYADFSAGPLNFTLGCTPESEGCENCYAQASYARWGRDFSKVTVYPAKLAKLWNTDWPLDGNVRGPRSKPLAFACDMSDLFHPEVPDKFIMLAFDTLAKIPEVDFLILTKRAFRMAQLISTWAKQAEGRLPRNIWPGVTGETELRLAERWSWIWSLAVEGPRWISVEPMLGPIDLGDARPDWVVCGAESGPNRRPFDKAWAIDLKSQCDERGIPYFFKQSSGLYPGTDPTLKGREWKAWPRSGLPGEGEG